MSDIEEIVLDFVEERLAIDYSEASEDQMLELEELFNALTSKRPHDGQTYSEHMMKYKPDGYCFLACDESCVSSYGKYATTCRPHFITLAEVLRIADVDVKVDVKDEEISKADFDSLF